MGAVPWSLVALPMEAVHMASTGAVGVGVKVEGQGICGPLITSCNPIVAALFEQRSSFCMLTYSVRTISVFGSRLLIASFLKHSGFYYSPHPAQGRYRGVYWVGRIG
jgi:hypothetical protein